MWPWIVTVPLGYENHMSLVKFVLFIAILYFTLINGCVSDKTELSNEMEVLVDKSLFIKNVIEQENKTLIVTAPTGFGKTTNLNMLKSFLEIEVDEKGERKTKVDPHKMPITDTNNYRSFVKNRYNITECKTIMDNYLGKYPVISLSFECFSVITNVEDAIKLYKRAVHTSYKDHEYLTTSERLSLHDRKLVRFWSDDHNYRTMTRRQVVTGVRELTRLVSRHWHDARAWVLVDDYDAVVQAAVVEAEDTNDVTRVATLTSRLLTYVFVNNSECVCGGVLTGVLPLHGVGLQTQVYSLLGGHQFEAFYGITGEEFERVLRTNPFRHNRTATQEAEENYGDYLNKNGQTVYSLRSVLRVLKTGKYIRDNTVASRISELINALKIQPIRKTLRKLLKGEAVPFHPIEAFDVEDLIELRSMLLKPESGITEQVTDLFLSYLLHEGLISQHTSAHQVTDGAGNLSYAIISNKDIASGLNKLLN